MKAKLVSALCAAILLALASSGASAKTLVIGLDISTSNPVIHNDSYASYIGKLLGDRVQQLDFGDTVVIETFGHHGELLSRRTEITISKKLRHKKVAHFVRQLVAALPKAVRKGKLQPHPATNIISFLRTRAERHGCGKGLSLLVATDGAESSDVVDEKALRAGKASLPAPSDSFLEGCEVGLFGVGEGAESLVSQRLRKQWRDYLDAAGAEPVRVDEG